MICFGRKTRQLIKNMILRYGWNGSKERILIIDNIMMEDTDLSMITKNASLASKTMVPSKGMMKHDTMSIEKNQASE
jgi:hypothetical protein